MITDRKINPSQACTYYKIHGHSDPCPNSPTRMVDNVPMCDECYSDYTKRAKREFRDMIGDADRFVYVDDESGLSDGIL